MAKKKKPEIIMASVAVIDDAGLFQGVIHIPETEITDQHVRVPADCDLAPGGYKWDEVVASFMPTKEFIEQTRKLRGK